MWNEKHDDLTDCFSLEPVNWVRLLAQPYPLAESVKSGGSGEK